MSIASRIIKRINEANNPMVGKFKSKNPGKYPETLNWSKELKSLDPVEIEELGGSGDLETDYYDPFVKMSYMLGSAKALFWDLRKGRLTDKQFAKNRILSLKKAADLLGYHASEYNGEEESWESWKAESYDDVAQEFIDSYEAVMGLLSK